MSAFDELDALASDASVTLFGEEAILSPRRNGQYAEASPDADRRAVAVRGVFSAVAATTDLKGQSRGGEFAGTTRLVAAQSTFWIAAAEATVLGFRPARGDLLRLTGRSGEPSFAISAVHPASMGDLNLLLVREDVAE